MTDPSRSLRRTAITILLTAAVAFPAGLWLARAPEPATPASRAASSSPDEHALRNIYSADIRGDPAVVAAQLRVVEALESTCRDTRTQCAEARGARSYIDARAGEW